MVLLSMVMLLRAGPGENAVMTSESNDVKALGVSRVHRSAHKSDGDSEDKDAVGGPTVRLFLRKDSLA